MASTSETGHAKNVVNFEILISFCTSYGTDYNPSRTALQLPPLNALHASAQSSIASVTNINTALINATNARKIIFHPIKPLATRIINALDATEATGELVKDAKPSTAKFREAVPKQFPSPGPPIPKTSLPKRPNPFPFHNKASTAF